MDVSALWNDRAGRFSPLKAATLAAAFLPAVWIGSMLALGQATARPTEYAIHEIGEWAVRFLLLGLAVTPFRRALDWSRLIQVRRMLGLTALAYALAHLAAYAVDQNLALGRVASEIVSRVYLAIGFTALIGLCVLGATSTDAMIRRLGRTWTRLHRLVYPIAALALAHQFMQSKADVTEPTVNAGLFVLLMAYRVAAARGVPLTPVPLALLAAAAVPATMGIEALWYALGTALPVDRVFLANFDFSYTVRPSWWVGAVGLAVAAVAAARRGTAPGRRAAAGRARRSPAE